MQNVVEGTVKIAHEIGHVGYGKWIWTACEDCGKSRWVILRKGTPGAVVCKSCANRRWLTGRKREEHPAWKGGRFINSSGYLYLCVPPESAFYPMTNCKGYVPEHRLVVAKHLGRNLLDAEVVHHLNGNKTDNRFVNLILTDSGKHKEIIPALQKRIRELELRLSEGDN